MYFNLQLHSFHQSLRDISSEQVRLGDDISRELSRRDRYTPYNLHVKNNGENSLYASK